MDVLLDLACGLVGIESITEESRDIFSVEASSLWFLKDRKQPRSVFAFWVTRSISDSLSDSEIEAELAFDGGTAAPALLWLLEVAGLVFLAIGLLLFRPSVFLFRRGIYP